ncbi:MAG: TetR/AcrR family transcriptional regulator [Magnetococcales bacterium]|nr:TetR/AcrR family transcriptional regulator [Magnetococcales bacterium]MBF0149981.1 TetR/AcrR family transcriptional regulator [Magnetococcales bacterium]
MKTIERWRMGRTSDARERLIQSGLQLIHAGGYGPASVREICELAKVQKGSFYHFFASKNELALAVLDHFMAEAARPLMDLALASDLPPVDRIRRVFRMIAEGQEAQKSPEGLIKGCPLGNLALEVSVQDRQLRLRIERAMREVTDRIRGVIREQVGPEAPEEQVQRKAETVFALLEGAIMLAKVTNDAAAIHRSSASVPFIVLAE